GAEGRNYFIPNLWPLKPQGFADAAQAYYAEMENLAALMLRLTALALDLDEHFFDDKIDRHITAMRLNFYPEQTSAPKPGQLRAGAHTDYGVFTILNGESVPGGLEVLAKNGGWIAVETEPETFVVNIGNLLMRWTNDRWVSNTHRVGNPPASVASQAKRLSIAFFQQPNYDSLIECIAPAGKAKYPPVRSGEYRDLKYRQTTGAVACPTPAPAKFPAGHVVEAPTNSPSIASATSSVMGLEAFADQRAASPVRQNERQQLTDRWSIENAARIP